MVALGITTVERASLWVAAFVVAFTVGFILLARRPSDIFEWLVYYLIMQSVFIVVPLFYLAASGNFEQAYTWTSGLFSGSDDLIFYTAVAGVLYAMVFLCVAIGYSMKIGKHIGNRLPVPGSYWSHRRVAVVIVILSLVGVFSYLRYMEEVGGFQNYVSNLGMRWTLEYMANKYWRWGATMWPLASLIWVTYHFSRGGNRLVWLHVGLSLAMWATFSLRGEIINMIISISILYHYTQQRLKINQRTLAIVLLCFGALIASTYLRNPISHGDDLSLILVGNYGGLSSTAMLLKAVPEFINLQWGKSFMEVFLMPIPRFLWSSKPVGIGHWVATAIWPGATGGPALNSLEEFLINFYLLGVFVGMILIGIVGRVLYTYLKNYSTHPGVIVLYASLITWGGGAVSGYVVGYGQRIIPLMIALLFLGGSGLNRSRGKR